MGAPRGNKNAAGSRGGSGRITKARKRYPSTARGIYGEKVRILEIRGHSATTTKGSYHTSKLFNRAGKSLWKKRGY